MCGWNDTGDEAEGRTLGCGTTRHEASHTGTSTKSNCFGGKRNKHTHICLHQKCITELCRKSNATKLLFIKKYRVRYLYKIHEYNCEVGIFLTLCLFHKSFNFLNWFVYSSWSIHPFFNASINFSNLNNSSCLSFFR